MTNNPSITRRRFLRTAGATLALPYVIPSRSRAAAAPSERITLGAIGLGGRGRSDLKFFLTQSDVQVLAIQLVHQHRQRRLEQPQLLAVLH